MPAYWIAHVTVTDPDRYKGYQTLAPDAFTPYGARFLARGGDFSVMEGQGFDRHVVIEKGHVVWTGTSADIAADPTVRTRYLQV